MDFLDLIKERESCRQFNGKPIDKSLLHQMVEAGRLAPSACNGQPWHFYIVTNVDEMALLATSMQAFNQKAGAFIVIVEEGSNLTSTIGSAIKGHNFPQIDIGIVATHIVYAAKELGVECCIIGWFNEKAVKRQLKIAKGKRVRLIISLGYTDNGKLRDKKRKPLEDIATFIE